MPEEVQILIANAVHAISLKILVFGPQVHTPSPHERTAKLQAKRIDIRARLEIDGHFVRYAEDLVDPMVGDPAGNAFFQEILIMGEYDLIVTIVDSPGSIVEATTIALSPQLAQKASLFLDSEYKEGMVGAACRNAEDIGAHFQTYSYPHDLDECHLLGHVVTRVRKIQKIKYLM